MAQNNIVKFLSEHRRYRVFGWEFGPTLLDHLHKVKEDTYSDYTKNGLILTYSIASAALLISLASTRKVAFAAVITSGVMLLGITTTVAIDYYSTKGTNEAIEQKHCLELLQLLGETPKYWWWPWSSKVSQVILTESQKKRAEKYASYSFLYRVMLVMFTSVLTHRFIFFQQNGGYMKRNQQSNFSAPGGAVVRDIDVPTEAMQPDIRQQTMQQPSDQQSSPQRETEQKPYSQNLSDYQSFDSQAEPSGAGMQSSVPGCSESINFLEFAMVYQMNLEKALSSLGFSYKTLSSLDESLGRVRNLGYSKDAINEYNQSFIKIFSKQYRELALKFHSDKGGKGMDTLNNIKEVMEELYETSKKERDTFRYKTFAEVALDFLHKNRGKYAGLINENVVAELRNITIWRQADLLYCRNEFLEKTQECFEVYLDNPTRLKQEFDKLVNDYVTRYQEFWLDNLVDLKFRCDKDKSLEVIKDEVKSLVKDSTGQCIRLADILPDRKKNIKELKKMLLEPFQIDQYPADKCFVLPILEYNEVAQGYFELLSNKSVKHLTKIFEEHAIETDSIESDVKVYINRHSLVELQECIKSFKEGSFPEIINFMCGKTYSVPEYMFRSREATEEEIGKMILVQMLKKYVSLLKEEFKKEKTWFKRMEEEIREQEKEIKKQHEMQKQANTLAEQNAQRADQNAQRAEHINVVGKFFTRKICKLDDELQDIVIESQEEIVEAVVQHVMEHNSSAEQVLGSIIEEIKFNRTQVIRDNTVNAELVEMGIRSFSSQGSSLSNVAVNQGASAGIGRN